jgi:hypothetical protein
MFPLLTLIQLSSLKSNVLLVQMHRAEEFIYSSDTVFLAWRWHSFPRYRTEGLSLIPSNSYPKTDEDNKPTYRREYS